MKYIVIGLGIYGRTIAQDLAALGHDVIAVDNDPSLVDHIKDRVATTFAMDSTDEDAIEMLPLKEVDLVIVAIGENFGASIRTVALLKKKGVQHIYARALDDVQKSVFEVFELDHVMTPEEESARNLVREMDFGSRVDIYPVDKKHYVFTIKIPSWYVGNKLSSLRLEERYSLKPITVKRTQEHRNILGMRLQQSEVLENFESENLQEGDELVCYGTYESYQNFCKDQK